jgi:hypothetical protein
MFLCSFVFGCPPVGAAGLLPNEKPAIDWQSRVFLNSLDSRLKTPSRVAGRPRTVAPNVERLAVTTHGAQTFDCNRVVHFLINAMMKHHFGRKVKAIFCENRVTNKSQTGYEQYLP